ncbi:MAG: TIGR04255 family protein, partial [Nitrospirota bacterium]
MKIPVKITPCPIVEAIVEIKFDYDVDLDPDAIFGIVYKELHEKFPQTTKLPILQLPDAVRLRDPNLISQPHYKLSNEKFLFQIGPRVMSLNNVKGYVGWTIFYKELIDTFSL